MAAAKTKAADKLPKAFKKQWIKALRSGEYKQNTAGSLYDRADNSYCCLGVAGHLCRVIGMSNFGFLDNGSNFNFAKQNSKLRGLTKVPETIKGGKYNRFVNILSTMNDNGSSFEQIADYIQKNL